MTISLTLIIIIITCLVSYQAFENRDISQKLRHHPYSEKRNSEFYRFISSGFVHGDWMHLLINMYVLYEFGTVVEMKFLEMFGDLQGRLYFLALYFLTIMFADIPTYIKHKDNPGFASVGASGGVSGILFVYVLFHPWSWLLLYFIIPIPAILAAVAYVIYSSWASKNSQGRIDHDAHLYGAIFGFLFAIVLRPSLFNDFLTRLTQNGPW